MPNELLSQLRENMAVKEDLGKLRNELGSLKFSLQGEMRLLNEQGHKMSPAERTSHMKHIDQGIAQARDLENRIVANDPAAAKALANAREEMSPLMKQMHDAQMERQRLLNDNIPNFLQSGQLSKQDADIAKLHKGLEAAVAHQNAALGMTPQLMARIGLVETRKEIDGLGNAMSDPKLPPADRQRLMQRMDGLQAKARDQENAIVAGNPQAQKELADLRAKVGALAKDAHKLLDEIHQAHVKRADPQTIAKLEKELAGVDADLKQVRLAGDMLLGLVPAETAAPPAVDTPPASDSKKLNTSGPLNPTVQQG
jgi:predicted  nucleic acid-binding Zn-ribbon protein